MLDITRTDLSELGRLLDSRDHRAGILNPETGEVWLCCDGEIPGIDSGDITEEDIEGWVSIPGHGSQSAYADMVDFVAVVPDPSLRQRLEEALDGSGAFRRFRNVAYDTADEIGKAWNRFSDARACARAARWLQAKGLVEKELGSSERRRLEKVAEEILTGIRGETQPLPIIEALRAMVADREWSRFHTPANLAKSIAIEAGELLECYQWSEEADLEHVRSELADVLTYCLLLADRLDLDPEAIVRDKLTVTATKYPVEKAKGRSTKYDRLPD